MEGEFSMLCPVIFDKNMGSASKIPLVSVDKCFSPKIFSFPTVEHHCETMLVHEKT